MVQILSDMCQLRKNKARSDRSPEAAAKGKALPPASRPSPARQWPRACPKKRLTLEVHGTTTLAREPDLVFRRFSPRVHLKLMQNLAVAWLHMTEAWYTLVKEKVDRETADMCETAALVRFGARGSTRECQRLGQHRHPGTGRFDCFEVPPAAPGQHHGRTLPGPREIITRPRHWTIRGAAPWSLRAKAPERIKYVCYETRGASSSGTWSTATSGSPP